MKTLRVTMPDGSRWDVPAAAIAENRARYYAEKDQSLSTAEMKEIYDQEYVATLNDSYEIKDWALNNMNWPDVSVRAKRVEDVNPLVAEIRQLLETGQPVCPEAKLLIEMAAEAQQGKPVD